MERDAETRSCSVPEPGAAPGDILDAEQHAQDFDGEQQERVTRRAERLWGQKNDIHACLRNGDYYNDCVAGPGIRNYGYFQALESSLEKACPELMERPLDILPAALEMDLVKPYVTVMQEINDYGEQVSVAMCRLFLMNAYSCSRLWKKGRERVCSALLHVVLS